MNDAPIDAPEVLEAPVAQAEITRPADVPDKFWDDDAGLDTDGPAKLGALALIGLVDLALELLDESLVDRCGHRTYFPGWRKGTGRAWLSWGGPALAVVDGGPGLGA